MCWVLMSERDVRRIEVLTEVFSGRRTVASAAVVLAITVRQVNRPRSPGEILRGLSAPHQSVQSRADEIAEAVFKDFAILVDMQAK
jgi:hypothetical protein